MRSVRSWMRASTVGEEDMPRNVTCRCSCMCGQVAWRMPSVERRSAPAARHFAGGKICIGRPPARRSCARGLRNARRKLPARDMHRQTRTETEEIAVPDTVAEIMDPEFFHACQTDSIGRLLHDMAELGI